MINGDWGSGKTHLIKKILRLDEEDNSHIYISLYGLSSTEQISEEIFLKTYPKLDNKAVKIMGVAGKTALKYFKVDPSLEFSDFAKANNKRLYIFDDLERAAMPVQEALGFINQMVEHDHCKVIIIANEDEIKEKDEYKRIKEKLIGKTLKIQSSLEDAIDYFISTISNDKGARDYLTKHRNRIIDVFKCADKENLRIFQQTLWDFQRLYDLIDKKYLDFEDQCLEMFLQFMALSNEFKAGFLENEEVTQFSEYAQWKFTMKEEKEIPSYKVIIRYQQAMNIQKIILPPQTLDDMIIQGSFVKEKINAHLEHSYYFQIPEEEKPWFTLLSYRTRKDIHFQTALSTINNQLKNKEILEIGEILHIFGTKLSLVKNNIISQTLDDIKRECKKYIDDLLTNGNLSPMPVSEVEENCRLGEHWGGVTYNEHGEMEFKELQEYIQEKRREAREQEYSETAKKLLNSLKSDFYSFNQALNNIYARVPILSRISAQDFVNATFDLDLEDQHRLYIILPDRYNYQDYQKFLLTEKSWLEEVKATLKDEQNKSNDKLRKFQINMYIGYIDQIVENWPDKDAKAVVD